MLPATGPEHGDQEPEAGHREAIDLTALRALRKSGTDVEALDLTAERLRHLPDVFTKAADDSRARADRYADRDDANGPHPVRDDQQAHRPQQPAPHRGRGGQPLSGPDAAHPVQWCAPTIHGIHSTEWSPPAGSGRHRAEGATSP
ncbi:hypothetical protein ACWCQS_44655 [Streptomyces sp. NPDC002076]